MISQLLSILSTIISTFVVTVIAIFWLLIKYPEKVEKWISMLARAIASVSERAARVHMATDVQSTIDESRKKINTHEETLAYGVSVKWTNADRVQTDLRENKVVIMMRPYPSQARNLAHIVSLYVPRALLPRARMYVEPNLMSGIDHTLSKSILEENTSALEYYLSEVIDKANDEVKSYVLEMDEIHKQGTLTRIMLPELKRLSILYPKQPDDRTTKETTELAELMYEFVTREPGEIGSPIPCYTGTHIKLAIVTVAKPQKLVHEKTKSHFRFIEGELGRGVNHFYIVSTGFFVKYCKDLIKDCQEKLNLVKVYEERYTGIFRGKVTELFCALLIPGVTRAVQPFNENTSS